MDFCDPTKEQKSLQYHIDKAKRSFQERLEYKPRLERNMERAKEFIKAVKVYISRGGQGSQALSQTLGDEEIRLIRFKADYERNKVKLKEIEEFLKENGVDVDALYY